MISDRKGLGLLSGRKERGLFKGFSKKIQKELKTPCSKRQGIFPRKENINFD
jgi:hypothetical protein